MKAAQMLYKKSLNKEDYDILSAESGREALLSYINKERIDIVLLNISLPDMTAVTFLKNLRKNHKDLPVLLMAGADQRNLIVSAAAYKIETCLTKPIDIKLMQAKVEEVLKRVHHRDEEESGDKKRFNEKELGVLNDISAMEIDLKLPKEIRDLKKQIKNMATGFVNLAKKESQKDKLQDAIWQKNVYCPVCATEFNTYNYKSKSFPVLRKESDFHEIYEYLNPLVFDIWVCPECFYAAKKDDFNTLDMKETKIIASEKPKRKKITGNLNYRMMRDQELGIASYRLAVMCYQHRKPSSGFYGSIYLKAAWLAREEKKEDQEKEFLELVAHYYEKSLSEGEKISGQLSELGLMYLLGDVYRRMGDLEKAARYLMKVKQDPDVRKEKAIMRMAEEQLEVVKEAKEKLKNANN